MTDPFDKLIEETREKYRVSWEKSLEKYKKFCKCQDEDFEWAITHGYFPPRITIEKILVEAKPRKLKAEYSLEVLQDKVYYSEDALKYLEGCILQELQQKLKQTHQEQLTSVLMHPEVYEAIKKFKNQNTLQRFVWNIKWGFRDCLDNFRNWQEHMRGEDWVFWEILNGELIDYE